MTQERLKELVHYEPKAGIFTSIVNRGKKIKIGQILGGRKSNKYINIWLDNKHHLAHRLAFLYMKGYLPEQIDHINQNREDNRWENLRGVSRQENAMNKSIQDRNITGTSGVTLRKDTNKWRAQITIKGKRYVSSHDTIEEAIKARKELKEKYGFHKNHS